MEPRAAPNEPRPVILALRALKLGDLLVAVPALRALRRAYPAHQLVVAVPEWLRPIVSLIDGVDGMLPTADLVQPLHAQPGSVDTVVNLHGRGPQSHLRLERLRAPHRIGHRAPGWDGPAWVDGMHERERWTRLLEAYGLPADPLDIALQRPERVRIGAGEASDTAIVHVGAAYGSRQWPIERFAAVASALDADGLLVVFTGSAEDRPRAILAAELAAMPVGQVVAGERGLGDFAALVASAGLVVTADTGAAHLASAYRVPSVVIFGPASPEEWGPPPGGPHLVLTDRSVRRGDVFGTEPDPALLAVSPTDVIAAARQLRSSATDGPR